jgi:molybdate transport system ATP-binding protein
MDLVTIERADVRLAGRTLLEAIDFTVTAGEHWALLGPNGSGKTSLLRLVRGELWPFPTGRRLYAIDGPARESPIGVRERVAIVSPELQDAYARREWNVAVERVVLGGFTDSVFPQEPPTPGQSARIDEVLGQLDLRRLARRPMLALSTGERRRVLLARALALRPRILLLDEATEGLDAAAREAFLGHVREAARAGTTLVVATHREEELLPEIRRVAWMEGGRIVRVGGRELLRVATPTATPTPSLTSSPGLSPTAPALLELRGVSVHLDDGTPVLRDLDWTLREGESWAVLGENGAGKTSFLKLVAGELREMPGGRVVRRGLPERVARERIREAVAFVGPELHARHVNDLPVLDVVVSGIRDSIGIDEPPSPAERDAASAALGRAGAAHLAGRRIHALSWGELRRVLVARALARAPRLLVLDEPFSGLDAASRASFAAVLERLAAEGVQLLVAAHHAEDLVAALRHVLVLSRGRVVRQGPRPA